MAWLSERIFSRAEAVELIVNGEARTCKGVITQINRETAEAGGKRHPLGVLSRPLYKFVGSVPNDENLSGAQLVQAGKAYTVLDSRRLMLGGRLAAVRLLLERSDDDEHNSPA